MICSHALTYDFGKRVLRTIDISSIGNLSVADFQSAL
jgi:hypothetical protein